MKEYMTARTQQEYKACRNMHACCMRHAKLTQASCWLHEHSTATMRAVCKQHVCCTLTLL
jgi:hypothetical protein